MSGVYNIVLGRSIWLWNPIPLEQQMLQALRSKKCEDIHLFSGAHLLQRCRAAGNEQHLDLSATCDGASGICFGIPLSSSAEVTQRPKVF